MGQLTRISSDNVENYSAELNSKKTQTGSNFCDIMNKIGS